MKQLRDRRDLAAMAALPWAVEAAQRVRLCFHPLSCSCKHKVCRMGPGLWQPELASTGKNSNDVSS